MNRWTPCHRNVFASKLRQLGFDGPFSGSKHQYMRYGTHRLTLPSNSEYSVPQIRMLIRQAERIMGHRVSLQEWGDL